ncbi:MAG: hypothetical protein JXB88_20535 [Spirochaetales bacterium]|nr:hypothetical protein [Spirochaetales bacterium]
MKIRSFYNLLKSVRCTLREFLTGTEGLPVMELDVKELTEEEAADWKGWHPHTGPPGYGYRDAGKNWNNDGKGGSK